MISEDFKNRLVEAGINPEDMTKFTSRYDKVNDVIITVVTTKDGEEHELISETPWYASRKNKRW